MGESFLPLIDVANYSLTPHALTEKQLSYFRRVHAQVGPAQVGTALKLLQQTAAIFDISVDVTDLDSTSDIISILDHGACKVFASASQMSELRSNAGLDLERIVLCMRSQIFSKDETDALGTVKCIQLDAASNLDFIKAQKEKLDPNVSIYATLPPSELQNATQLAKLGAIPIVPASCLTLSESDSLNKVNAVELFLANASSDRPDGLLSTLVADERGMALGMVFSSPKSVQESISTGRGVYQSRKRGLWFKGESSGDTQELVALNFDCDHDCLAFTVRQKGKGFCHLGTATCFGQYRGLSRLQQTLQRRRNSAPSGSYTARLFQDPVLLRAKIMEEASELCDATGGEDVAFEAADLFYFALTKCVASGVTLEDVERNLDLKSSKLTRRKGDAKSEWLGKTLNSVNGSHNPEDVSATISSDVADKIEINNTAVSPAESDSGAITMKRCTTSKVSKSVIFDALKRPSQRSMESVMGIVKPIIDDVRQGGDKILVAYTHKFDKALSLTSPAIHAPFSDDLMTLPPETIKAMDISFNNIRRFHEAQRETKQLSVETMPGVVCSRFSRPIERVGLYVPGGTAVLPSSALMLGVPAMVAGCQKIVLATPPRPDGSLTPEIVYAAHKIGATSIVLAGGAQAVAALAYGTESVSKVDKILGPGNQFVTAAKMLVSNDTSANVSIDMPAGPSEVLVIADETSNAAFVASDLLSQAEHGPDSQVVLIAVNMSEAHLKAVETELHNQAATLPRVDIVRKAISHSVTLVVETIEEAMHLSNEYAPEHLILQCRDAPEISKLVQNAGSVFIGPWTPESVGDYSAGVNHSLPTYGYARQYSGVNLGSYLKHITSSQLTADGLRNVGPAVMQLAKVEQLEAHRRAVSIRLSYMNKTEGCA